MKAKLALLGAAIAAATLALPASANDRNVQGNPASFPTSPSESRSLPVREAVAAPAARSDNPNLPNPVTPSGANESAAQPQSLRNDPTNQPGIPGYPVGATR